MTITYKKCLPTSNEFQILRNHTEWGVPDLHVTETALNGSLCGSTVYDNNMPIGMVRVIGDGALNLYIQDLIIHRDYRKRGIGHALLKRLVKQLIERYPRDITVGLMAVSGLENYYELHGFMKRPNLNLGPGMSASLLTLAKAVKRA